MRSTGWLLLCLILNHCLRCVIMIVRQWSKMIDIRRISIYVTHRWIRFNFCSLLCFYVICFPSMWFRLTLCVVWVGATKVSTYYSETRHVTFHTLVWIVWVVALRVWNICFHRKPILYIQSILLTLILLLNFNCIFINFNFTVLCVLIECWIHILKSFTSKIAVYWCRIVITRRRSNIATLHLLGLTFSMIATYLIIRELYYHWSLIFYRLFWFGRTF